MPWMAVMVEARVHAYIYSNKGKLMLFHDGNSLVEVISAEWLVGAPRSHVKCLFLLLSEAPARQALVKTSLACWIYS